MQTASLVRSNPALVYPFPMLMPPAAGLADSLPHVLGRIRRLQRNAAIYNEGFPTDHLYKVVSGTVRNCRFRMDGRRLIAQFALPGEIFGLDGTGQHRFTAEAVTEVVVVAFSRQEIEDWLEREPLAGRSWQHFTLARLTDAQDRFEQLGWSSARQRLAAFLLDLAARGDAGGSLVGLPMSRYDIGDYLGLTAETVSRLFSSFRRRRLIANRGQHQVAILDRAGLEEQASEDEG